MISGRRSTRCCAGEMAKEGPPMAHVYRADTIGSLLRPPYLKLAREQFEAGQLAPAAYKEIEDRAVDQALAMQEGVGLDVVTDGELRRHTFIDQLTEQVEELARMGCRYIQVDAPDFGQLVDPSQREAWERAGISVDRVFSEGADMLNELAGVAGVSFGLHLCRGNYDSDWISTGTYEAISKQLFQRATNYDTFLLEYDDERSGSFSALGDVPDDKTVVLGLVSTKFDRMERGDQLAARISEASAFFPLEQLALSTQCGFASAGPGNQISEDAQENKLRLVGEVADRVWG